MTQASVFLASAATLAFEVLLTRMFSISQWNHLSFMVISIALFGFAASGSLLSLQRQRQREWIRRLSAPDAQPALCAGFCLSALAATALLICLPIDYFRLPVQPVQFFYLLAAYTALIIPFFFTGMIIIVAYTAQPHHSGRTYFAIMTASAAGAFYPALWLPHVSETRLLLITAVMPFLVLLLLRWGFRRHIEAWPVGRRMTLNGLGILLTMAVVAHFFYPEWPRVRFSDYKALAQALQMPDTRITATRNALQGRVDRIESPFIRYAPGLSLTYTGRMPPQQAVFRDGEHRLVLYETGTDSPPDFARHTLSYVGYRLAARTSRVLILLNGGGVSIPCALAAGADHIVIVQSHPQLARIVGRHYQLPVIHLPQRVYLKSSQARFDVIQVENWGSSVPGTAALDQDYMFTTDSIRSYLEHLQPGGILIMSRRLMLPPSDSLRLWASAYESLAALGAAEPGRHLLVLRNWDTYTLLASPRPFTDQRRVLSLAETFNFDPVYLDQLPAAQANRYNIFDAPFHYRALQQLAEAYGTGRQKAFFSEYPMDIAAQSDDRPFPARVLKWHRLGQLYQSTGSRLYSLLLSGEIIVAVVFLQALGVAAGLILLPMIVRNKLKFALSARHFLYFTAVGLGFMAVEFYFLKALVLLCGDPIGAFTLVVAGILVFSGIGGFLSQRLDARRLPLILMMLMLLLTGYLLCMPAVMDRLLEWSGPRRLTVAFFLLMPPGMITGLPFPLGMRSLLTDSAERSEAWTVNGCASVLSAIVAAQAAISLGIPGLLVGGIAAYGLALICSMASS